MFVLQSCSNSLHILPGLCSETHATSGGGCNFSNMEFEEDVEEMEVFMSINEEVDRGIYQEEIPGDITLPDKNCEPDQVSYICMSVIGDILRVSGNYIFLVMSVFLANLNNFTVGNKNVFCGFFYRWRVCSGWVGGCCTG